MMDDINTEWKVSQAEKQMIPYGGVHSFIHVCISYTLNWTKQI